MLKRTLLCIDIQKEYITEGREYCISGIQKSLENARAILEVARNNHWQVFHVKHVQEHGLFAKNAKPTDYIEGFEPIKGEHEFSKSDYSCYSSTHFREAFKRLRDEEIFVMGYGSTKCVMATIIEGYHKGQKFTFVSDASAAKKSGELNEETLHRHATEILKSFAKSTTTEKLLASA